MTTTVGRSFAHPVVLTIAVMLLAVIMILSFLPPTVVAPGKWNAGHAPAYAALVMCAIFSLTKTWRTPRVAVWIGVAASLLGGMIELLQPLAGRSTSLVDFGYNVLGVVVGLMLFASYARMTGHCGWRRTCKE